MWLRVPMMTAGAFLSSADAGSQAGLHPGCGRLSVHLDHGCFDVIFFWCPGWMDAGGQRQFV